MMKKVIILVSLAVLIPTLTIAGPAIKLNPSEEKEKANIKCFSERGEIIYEKKDVNIDPINSYIIDEEGKVIEIGREIRERCIVEYKK